MFAKINISLFVFTIILMSITWQNVLHHIHSEAALLCIIIFFVCLTSVPLKRDDY